MDEEGLWTEDNLQPLEQAASECRQDETLSVGRQEAANQPGTEAFRRSSECGTLSQGRLGIGVELGRLKSDRHDLIPCVHIVHGVCGKASWV